MKKAYQKKHLKKKRRSPLRTILFLLLLLVLIILIFLGIAFVKLGNIQTTSLDETQLVTVSELAAFRGGMVPGKVYSQFRP